MPLCVCFCRREFDVTKLERWEHRNADSERVNEHELLVHCKVHVNERDKKGEEVLMWLCVPFIMGVEGMDKDELDRMLEEYDDERAEVREEALRAFENL